MNQLLFLLESGASGGITQVVILYAAIFGIFWFFLIRPQRKKQKATEAMQNSIENGDSILTSGGLYGTVVDKVNDVYVVEFGLNKTVRVYLHKSSIASKGSPDTTVVNDKNEKE